MSRQFGAPERLNPTKGCNERFGSKAAVPICARRSLDAMCGNKKRYRFSGIIEVSDRPAGNLSEARLRSYLEGVITNESMGDEVTELSVSLLNDAEAPPPNREVGQEDPQLSAPQPLTR